MTYWFDYEVGAWFLDAKHLAALNQQSLSDSAN